MGCGVSNFHYDTSTRLVRLILAPFARVEVLHQSAPGEATPPFLLAGNHISHFDPPIFSSYTRDRVDWMAMEELFENRLLARYYRAVAAFPVNRFKPDRRAVRTALERLRAGRVVGIFPERGIRSGPESILGGAEIGEGAATLARLAKVPILPTVVIGSDGLYTPRVWRRWRSHRIFVGTGRPLAFDAVASSEALASRLRAAMRELASEMVDHFGIGPEEMPQTAARRKGREPA